MRDDLTHVWVLIPAARQHLALVTEALTVLGPDAGHAVIVTNGEHPLTEYETHTHVLQAGRGINIGRWWNMGLDWIEAAETSRKGKVTPHHVLVLNADARIGPEGVARLSWALDRDATAAMAGPMRGQGVHRETRGGPLGLDVRLPGYCFMLTSTNPLRADERFRWWCGDDDLEWRARDAGGTLLVGPIEFRHLGDGQPRGELLDLAKEDLIRFEEKWGIRPW